MKVGKPRLFLNIRRKLYTILSSENIFPMKCYADNSEFLHRSSVVIGIITKGIRDHQNLARTQEKIFT